VSSIYSALLQNSQYIFTAPFLEQYAGEINRDIDFHDTWQTTGKCFDYDIFYPEIESSTNLAIIPKEPGCCGFPKQVMKSYPDPSGKDDQANVGSSMNIKIREDLFVPWLACFPFDCLPWPLRSWVQIAISGRIEQVAHSLWAAGLS